MKTKFIFIILALFIVSCDDSSSGSGGAGGGLPGAGLASLTDNQKQQVTNFNRSLSDVTAVTEKASGNETEPLSKAQQDMYDSLAQAVQNNLCQMNAQETEFTINGDQCGIAYTSKTLTNTKGADNNSQTTQKITEQFEMDPQVSANLGLDVISFNSSVQTEKRKTLTETQYTDSDKTTADITAKSPTLGNVKIRVSTVILETQARDPKTLEVNYQKKSTITVQQNFQGFTAVGYVTSVKTQNGAEELKETTKFYLNGKEVSQQELFAIFTL